MPEYTIRDKTSGRELRVRGQRPPTQSEAAQLFQQAPEPAQPSAARSFGFKPGFDVGDVIEGGAMVGSFFPPTAPLSLGVLAGMGARRAVLGVKERDPVAVGFGALEALPGVRHLRTAGKVAQKVVGAVKPTRLPNVPTPASLRLHTARQPELPFKAATKATTDVVGASPTPAVARQVANQPDEAAAIGTKLLRQLRVERGADEAADVIQKLGVDVSPDTIRRIAGGPSRTPIKAVDRIADADYRRAVDGLSVATRDGFTNFFKNEGGQAAALLMSRLGLGATGAAVGATQGEDLSERVINGASLAAIGFLAPSALGKNGTIVSRNVDEALKESGVKLGSQLEKWRYFSMLSSPVTIMKAWGGAASGAVQEAAQRIAVGDPAGVKILRGLLSKSFRTDLSRAIANPKILRGEDATRLGRTAEGIVGLPTRLIGAFDYATTNAVVRATGMSRSAAQNLALSGHATTRAGRYVENASHHAVLRLFQPFVRVGVQLLERGLERLPGIGFAPRLASGGASRQLQLAKQATGALSIGVGAAVEDDLPPELVPLVAAFAGPSGLPFLMGLLTERERRQAGIEVGDLASVEGLKAVGRATQEIEQELPFLGSGLGQGVLTGITRVPTSMVPNILAVAARASDPADRDTTVTDEERETQLAPGVRKRIQERIPGLRESLPEVEARVGALGQVEPLRRNRLLKAIGPRDREGPQPDAFDPLVKGAREVGINLTAPRARFTQRDERGIARDVELPPEMATRFKELVGLATQQVLQDLQQMGAFTNTERFSEDDKQVIRNEFTRRRNALLQAVREQFIATRGQL